MIVAGASRHAKEVLQILFKKGYKDILLFDDLSNSFQPYFDSYKIIRSVSEIGPEREFILALGSPKSRFLVSQKLKNCGLKLASVISDSSEIGTAEVFLGEGLNIMNFVFISDCVKIGDGTLINAFASIHHDVIIGKYCEISPRSTILGGAQIGDFCSIGAGAVILPNIILGDNVIIGAGAVVTKNVASNSKLKGVPAKLY
jgi:sugar O-acyltransferase (sialic acid O-acetyltransferase NeuD family)